MRSIKDPGKDQRELTPVERDGALRARQVLDSLMVAFHDRYEQLKARRSGLDFADLELRALELLRSAPAVAEVWRGRFVHVMVDEFQDTNAVQLDLVEELRGPETRVFRVGDELQSIYRFRNADLAVFRSERQRAVADEATLVSPLTGNFRSRPELVAAVNTLGHALLGAGFRPLAYERGAAEGEGPLAELLLTLDEGKQRGWQEHAEALRTPPHESRARIVAEARGLARRLRELVDDRSEAIERGDIVVLLRAFTHVDAYEEALERAGLDPYVVGGRGYWSQQQVEDMLCLLGAVANPLDDEPLIGALASPACGASPDALWLLRRAATEDEHLWPVLDWRFGPTDRRPGELDEAWLEQIPSDDQARLESFCATLAQLRVAAALLPLEDLVERTMTAFDYDLSLLARRGGRGRMANVRKLIRLAREFEAHEGRDLRGFLAAAEELTERDEREGVAAIQAEDHDGVRIMTVHAAKGLEFPVVAVPDLGRQLSAGERIGDILLGRRDAGRLGIRLVLPAAKSFGVWELHELYAESVIEAAEEGCRLVHVAATRAQERLILSGLFKPADCAPAEAGPRDSAIARLLPALADLGWDPEQAQTTIELPPPAPGDRAPALRHPPRLAVRIDAPSADRAKELAQRLDPPPSPEPSATEGPPPLARPAGIVPVGHLSYSALAEYERCGYRFYVERLLGLDAPTALVAEGFSEGSAEPPPPGDRARGIGNAVHGALEWSVRRGWERPPAEVLDALLAEQGLAGDVEATERANALVDGWLGSSLRASLDASALRAEVPFALELAGTVVRGQIDLLAAGGEPTVLDYKTDALGDEGPAELGARYAAQREIYALAIAGANGGGEPTALRTVHCFLEAPDEPVVEIFAADRLEAARDRLQRLIDEIRSGGGGFEPTPAPTWAVCNGCPGGCGALPSSGLAPRLGLSDGAAGPVRLRLPGKPRERCCDARARGRDLGAAAPAPAGGGDGPLFATTSRRRRRSPAHKAASCRATASASTSSWRRTPRARTASCSS